MSKIHKCTIATNVIKCKNIYLYLFFIKCNYLFTVFVNLNVLFVKLLTSICGSHLIQSLHFCESVHLIVDHNLLFLKNETIVTSYYCRLSCVVLCSYFDKDFLHLLLSKCENHLPDEVISHLPSTSCAT